MKLKRSVRTSISAVSFESAWKHDNKWHSKARWCSCKKEVCEK